ncbi:MAG: hypothetical protein RCG15_03380 [Candidatus Rickettsia vulgarisii]
MGNSGLVISPNGGGTITIHNSITTTNNNQGTLNTEGNVNFSSNIGVGGATLSSLNFSGAGNVNLNSTSKAINFTVADAGANVIATNLMTGALNYTAAGSLTANGGLTGNVDFKNNAGTFSLGAGRTLTGNIDSTVGSNGTLEFFSDGIITGNITNIKVVKFSGTGPVTILPKYNNANILYWWYRCYCCRSNNYGSYIYELW